MILDTRKWKNLPFDQVLAIRRRVFVDNAPVNRVWYADTELNYVRSYDCLGDGRPHTVAELTEKGLMESDFDDIDGIASRTIIGKVTLREYDEEILR